MSGPAWARVWLCQKKVIANYPPSRHVPILDAGHHETEFVWSPVRKESRRDEDEEDEDEDDLQVKMTSEARQISDEDWWIDAIEVDTIQTMSLDGEGGLWSSAFVPPPPRPDFLDDDIATDGVTTCDLCTWARHHPLGSELDGKELSWVMTLIIVSLLSALIGAVVMITIIKCRNRLKHLGHTTGTCFCLQRDEERDAPSIHLSNRSTSRASSKEFENAYHMPRERRDGSEDRRQHRVWHWLSRRPPTAPSQLGSSAPIAPDNHYTVEETYPNNGEALYAELDRVSTNSPAYQNTGYADSEPEPDCMPSSAPSSAYYSDLSCAPSDRTYEAVGPPDTTSFWDVNPRRLPPPLRLSSIREMITVPSDYV
ncbi:hypothetical protein RUM43_003292 [Polyplax serrata]|uniref:Uncharacterized protein n=1 Tax=Polyplax serrata TaxID=468196 RepID=A0AAN8NWG0_POLSC